METDISSTIDVILCCDGCGKKEAVRLHIRNFISENDAFLAALERTSWSKEHLEIGLSITNPEKDIYHGMDIIYNNTEGAQSDLLSDAVLICSKDCFRKALLKTVEKLYDEMLNGFHC